LNLSACAAYHDYKADYLFIGTCFVTESHPEKGPDPIGRTRIAGASLSSIFLKTRRRWQALAGKKNHPPPVSAIGEINASNCHTPIQFGADGVATIRALQEALSPLEVVQ